MIRATYTKMQPFTKVIELTAISCAVENLVRPAFIEDLKLVEEMLL